MFTRIVILTLIAMLAMPFATLTRPGDTGQRLWSDVAVAAKGKHHKKKSQKKAKTDTRTVRQPVTQTFVSTNTVTIDDDTPATLYPSTIEVTGFTSGTITDVNLVLENFTHTCPRDVDILLSTNDGRRALVMSDIGDGDDVVNIDLTLDDEAAAPLPAFSSLLAGAFQPTNFQQAGDPDLFAAPAPAPNGNINLSTFDGTDPNGTWRLWVIDDVSGDVGVIGGGWSLQITAETDVQVQEQVPVTKDKQMNKKDKKHKQGRK